MRDRETKSIPIEIEMPSSEDIAKEVARELSGSFRTNEELKSLAKSHIERGINDLVSSRLSPIIDELLAKQLRPTDGFGNPVGEPTSLQAVITHRVNTWADEVVDADGKPKKPDAYNKGATRMEWFLGQILNREMRKAIDAQIAKLIRELNLKAVNVISTEIGEKISHLFMPKEKP